MSKELPDSSKKVQDFLVEKGFSCTVTELPDSTRTVKERVGFAIGGVPPVGKKEKIITFLDPDLMKYEWIWAAAGTPFAVFRLNSNEIQKTTEGKFIDLKVDDGKN